MHLITSCLTAGISIIGSYLVAGDAEFAATVPQLCALAKALSANVGDDSLLLHIAAVSGKVRAARLAVLPRVPSVLHLLPNTRRTMFLHTAPCLRCSSSSKGMKPALRAMLRGSSRWSCG